VIRQVLQTSQGRMHKLSSDIETQFAAYAAEGLEVKESELGCQV